MACFAKLMKIDQLVHDSGNLLIHIHLFVHAMTVTVIFILGNAWQSCERALQPFTS